MLAIPTKQLNSIFERIIRDRNGVLVLVRFTVVEINGKFQPQIISAEALVKNKESVVFLPEGILSKDIALDTTPSFISTLSPYINLDFFMSQPTRAPSM
ncbi:hypothetical protein EB001_05805 [bacterium]|nr:hypothetical protein [bacterium]